MQNDRASILLIGSGRLYKHLRHWNTLLVQPHSILTWNRAEDVSLLQLALQKVSLVWLAISDSALVSFYEKHLQASAIQTVHFSGALHDERLYCAHPLMSFPSEILPDAVYPNIHFAVTGAPTLNECLPQFANSFSLLAPENKSLYHALCVVSGNFPQLLWNETLPQFRSLQIPEKAFELYIHQITENFIRLKKQALTGPLVRKDLITIEKNTLALQNSKLSKVYQSFAEEFTK